MIADESAAVPLCHKKTKADPEGQLALVHTQDWDPTPEAGKLRFPAKTLNQAPHLIGISDAFTTGLVAQDQLWPNMTQWSPRPKQDAVLL